MAVAAYNDDLTTMDDAESATGWAEYTASGWTSIFSGAATDTDDFVENATCISSTVKTGVGGIPYNNGSGITLATDEAVLIWAKWDATGGLTATSSGGIRLTMGSSLSVFYGFDQSGSDELPYGMGWRCYALGDPDDSEITPDYTVGGISSGFTKQYFGWAFNASSVPSKGNPYKVDAVRYGRCEIEVTAGEAAAYGTFAGMAAYNDLNVTTYRRLGLFQEQSGAYLWKGLMSLGTATTAVDFRDSNVTINIDDVKHVTANFNKIEVNHASSRVDWTGVTINNNSTQSPGRFEAVGNATINLVSCVFNLMDTFVFDTNSTARRVTFNGCGQITSNGADLCESVVQGYEGTANTSAVIYNVNTDPDGLMDDMVFQMGTTATHAIEFGASIPASVTLRRLDFTGYNASQDNNASIFHFKDTSGTITLNLVGCTSDVAFANSYRTDGATINVVEDPVTTLVNVKDPDGNNEQNVRVLLFCVDGGLSPYTGLPVNETITSIVRGSPNTVATVTHNGHGLSDNKHVIISGANQWQYNGVKTITNTTTNTYDITLTSDPGSDATGTLIASAVIISGLTDASGNVSDSRTLTTDQPYEGWVRLSSGATLFQQAELSGTISQTAGRTISVKLVSDE